MCVLWVRANDHVKPIIGPHDPARMGDLGLYMWSEVGHSGNTLELWCLQSFSLLEIPSGYKTLGQVAWTTTLGVEALRKKVVRLRPSKKSEGEKKKYDDLWFLGPSHGDLYIYSQSFVLDSQKNFNESPHSSKSVAVASPLLWFRLCSRSFPIIVHLQGTNIGTHLFQHHYEWNPLFFTENRVCRPPNTVHQHLGQKCEWVFVRGGRTDSCATPSMYTACAGPILSFPGSKTEKCSLRKISPRIQVSEDVFTVFSLNVV